MGTIPNDPLDDVGNGGGISGSSEPLIQATDPMSHTPVYDDTTLGEGYSSPINPMIDPTLPDCWNVRPDPTLPDSPCSADVSVVEAHTAQAQLNVPP